jgi:DNA-binding FadR family transcriptional regulator
MMLTPRSGRSAQKLPRDGYLYLDVARRLRRRVEKGSYPPGSKLPSLADLCAEFDVSAITVRNALRELMQERQGPRENSPRPGRRFPALDR